MTRKRKVRNFDRRDVWERLRCARSQARGTSLSRHDVEQVLAACALPAVQPDPAPADALHDKLREAVSTLRRMAEGLGPEYRETCEEIAALLSEPPADAALLDGTVARILTQVCELPDRDSPEDRPEMLLVTSGELEAIVRNELSWSLARAATPAAAEPEDTARDRAVDAAIAGSGADEAALVARGVVACFEAKEAPNTMAMAEEEAWEADSDDAWCEPCLGEGRKVPRVVFSADDVALCQECVEALSEGEEDVNRVEIDLDEEVW